MSVCNLYLVTEVSSVLLKHYRRPLRELSDNDIQFRVMLLYLCNVLIFCEWESSTVLVVF